MWEERIFPLSTDEYENILCVWKSHIILHTKHTLDLILSFGLQLNVSEICDIHIPDHLAMDRHVPTNDHSTTSEFSACMCYLLRFIMVLLLLMSF